MKRLLIIGLCAAAMMLATGVAGAGTTFTGDPAGDGWTFLGNSLGSNPVIWERGSTLCNYDVYSTAFTLTAGDSISQQVSNDPTGSNAALSSSNSLIGGAFNVGDTIIGVGVTMQGPNPSLPSVTNGAFYMFVGVDPTGGNFIHPASSVGGTDGTGGATSPALPFPADGILYTQLNQLSQGGSIGWVPNEYYIFYASSSAQPYGTWGTVAGNPLTPMRTVADVEDGVPGNGDNLMTSIEIFYDASDIGGGPNYTFEVSVESEYTQSQDTNTAVTASGPVVPEPISMIFFGTGLVAVGGYISRMRMLRK